MRTYSHQFVNELGNRVSVRVHEETRYGAPGVVLHVGGPDSEGEFFVTRQEALELLTGLTRVLKTHR